MHAQMIRLVVGIGSQSTGSMLCTAFGPHGSAPALLSLDLFQALFGYRKRRRWRNNTSRNERAHILPAYYPRISLLDTDPFKWGCGWLIVAD